MDDYELGSDVPLEPDEYRAIMRAELAKVPRTTRPTMTPEQRARKIENFGAPRVKVQNAPNQDTAIAEAAGDEIVETGQRKRKRNSNTVKQVRRPVVGASSNNANSDLAGPEASFDGRRSLDHEREEQEICSEQTVI